MIAEEEGMTLSAVIQDALRSTIMKKDRTRTQEVHSLKEFEKKYYPESYKKQSLEISDPNTLGIVLARESLNKFKQLIQKQKVCV